MKKENKEKLIKVHKELSEVEAYEILDDIIGVRCEFRNELNDLISKIFYDKKTNETKILDGISNELKRLAE